MYKVCEVEGCGRPVVSLGNRKDSAGKPTTRYCDKHYARLKAHGAVDDNTRTHAPIEERFWRYVDKRSESECWEWLGAIDGGKYGQLKGSGKSASSYRAHRISYQIHHGDIPDGFVVMHTCDNRTCVNPLHLVLGTQQENVLDCKCKGRRVVNISPMKGEKNGRSKLTEQDVVLIRNSQLQTKQLQDKYKVSATTIRKIKRRSSWKDV